MSSPYQFQFGNNAYSLDQLTADSAFGGADAAALVVGSDAPGDDNVVHVFESEDDLSAWSTKTALASSVARAQEALTQLRVQKVDDQETRVRQMEEESDQIVSEIQALGKSTGLEWPSEELFRQAHESIFKTCVLFDFPNYSGWDRGGVLGVGSPGTELEFAL